MVPETPEEVKPEVKPVDEAPKPSGATVKFGTKPLIKPTLKLTPPAGGWNVARHQPEKKAVGKTKNS